MLVKADFFIGHGSTAGVGGLECFSDSDHHADHMVFGELNDLRGLAGVKADHRTGVVVQGFGGEHEGLRGDSD